MPVTRWNVEGADATTGHDRLVTVEAEDAKQAEVAARMKGLLVSAVHPVKVLSPAEKLDQMLSGKLDASTVTSTHMVEEMTDSAAAMLSNAQPSPPSLDYRSNPPDDHSSGEYRAGEYRAGDSNRALNVRFAANRAVPSYIGLRFAATILGTLAALSYVTGLLSVALAVRSMPNWNYLGSVPRMMDRIIALLVAGTPLVVGAIMHALASACLALRDIARNSHLKP